jgi:hypothetical protein
MNDENIAGFRATDDILKKPAFMLSGNQAKWEKPIMNDGS